MAVIQGSDKREDVWLEDYGAAVSEPFVVTDRGAERLCDVHRGLVVIS